MNRDILHDLSQLIIALALIGCTFVFLYALYFGGHKPDESLRESLVQVVGGVIGIVGTIVGFYFGTSLSSVRKDAVISKNVVTEGEVK